MVYQRRLLQTGELVQFITFENINVLFFGSRVFFPVSLIGYKCNPPQYFAFDSGYLYEVLRK